MLKYAQVSPFIKVFLTDEATLFDKLRAFIYFLIQWLQETILGCFPARLFHLKFVLVKIFRIENIVAFL